MKHVEEYDDLESMADDVDDFAPLDTIQLDSKKLVVQEEDVQEEDSQNNRLKEPKTKGVVRNMSNTQLSKPIVTGNFAKIVDGDNLFRLVSSPVDELVHWVNDDSGNMTREVCQGEGCPHCVFEAPKTRYTVKVIARDSGLVQELEFGPMVYKQIYTLHMKRDKELFDYDTGRDVSIYREGSGMETTYSVSAEDITPLTDAEKAAI